MINKRVKPKVTFEQLLAKYHEQIKAKDVDQTGIANPSRASLKPSKSPPKHKSRNQDWGGEEFHASATYPPFGPPIPCNMVQLLRTFILIHLGSGMIPRLILLHILDHIT